MKIIGKSLMPFNGTYRSIVAFASCSNATKNTYKKYTIHYYDGFYVANNDSILTIKWPGPYYFRAPYAINQNSGSTTVTAKYQIIVNNKVKQTSSAVTRDYGGTQYDLGNFNKNDTFYVQIQPIDTGTTVVGYFWLMYGGL